MSEWGLREWDNITENWPRDDAGNPVPPAFFEHIGGSQLDIDMEINMLDAYGIPSVLQYPNNGDLGRVLIGFAGGGADIFVPETMLEDARNVLSGDIEFDGEE